MAAKRWWHFEDWDVADGEVVGAGFHSSRFSLTFCAFKKGNRGVGQKRAPVRFAPSLQAFGRNPRLVPADIFQPGGLHRSFKQKGTGVNSRIDPRPLFSLAKWVAKCYH